MGSIRHLAYVEQVSFNNQIQAAKLYAWNLDPTEVACLKSIGVQVFEFKPAKVYQITRENGESLLDTLTNLAIIDDPAIAAGAHDALDNLAIEPLIDPAGAYAISQDGKVPFQSFSDLSIAARAAQQCDRRGLPMLVATRESPDGMQYTRGSQCWIDPVAAGPGAVAKEQDLTADVVLAAEKVQLDPEDKADDQSVSSAV